ncbi:Uncharacterised protein [Candidatus Venteria ishoeyi]|uniref:Uncharacterized protein n=1 Tax=Candidatus Venteria ishoeyi TaxID=1899563 RepID=A0A1H6F8T0_9GAMM|nr:Uncharacterised protein [Candidatus Venteria ishoeyi]
MIKIDYTKWEQNPQILRKYALTALHQRTRERFMSLYEITQGKSASKVALDIGRRPHTVLDWAHAYNAHGPDILIYKRSGGHRPLFHLKPVTTWL